MHESVLVMGVSNQEELEKVLAPFYQLGCTMNSEEIKADDRSKFEIEYTKEEAEVRYQKDIAEKPTSEQLAFFRNNFIEPSDENTCREMYAEKKDKRGPKFAPNGYTGEDFAYGNYTIANGDAAFFLISEENMKKCREWTVKHGLTLWELQHGKTKEKFIKETPDAHTLMTGSGWDLEWEEEEQGYGYWTNPNGFWDWYQVGGRWVGFFTIKKGRRTETQIGDPAWMMKIEEEDIEELLKKADVLTIGDIDFDAMEENAKENSAKQWDDFREMIFEGKGDRSDEEAEKKFREWMNSPEDETREEYIERNKDFGVSAIVFAGQWFERDKDGYYKCKSKGFEGGMLAKDLPFFLKNLQKELPLMLVDCHR